MSGVPQHFASIDAYIAIFPPEVQVLLREVRRAIHRAAPDAGETISYQIPTITLGGTTLIYFAGWKHHIALYPVPEVDEATERELAPYRAAKSTLRFPLKNPIPTALIERLTALAVAPH
ncbi:iron chaperone [Pengzhenrongella sp.]|uniref:iron chaperone n=1 Tax=Pengzhenrongella sp. TaxID=2888820 RepID=UPI002F944F9E